MMSFRPAAAFEASLHEDLEHIADDILLAAIKVLDTVKDQALGQPKSGRWGTLEPRKS